jgi:hypothetical protein
LAPISRSIRVSVERAVLSERNTFACTATYALHEREVVRRGRIVAPPGCGLLKATAETSG